MPGWPILASMQEAPRNHYEVIKALGGPVTLARDLGIERPVPATLHWGRRGIPSRYWHRVTELLAAKGVELTAHDIERLPIQFDRCAA